jgi:hypothetical protein
MRYPIGRIVLAALIAAVGIYLGLRLAIYSEQDDAPGGVLIGAALMFGSLGFGIWLALRGHTAPPRQD